MSKQQKSADTRVMTGGTRVATGVATSGRPNSKVSVPAFKDPQQMPTPLCDLKCAICLSGVLVLTFLVVSAALAVSVMHVSSNGPIEDVMVDFNGKVRLPIIHKS